MNLDAVLRARWAANGALEALLPIANVQTGTYFAKDPTFPYGTITGPGNPPGTRTNEGATVDDVTVRVAIYHDRNRRDDCKAIADAVRTAFNTTRFGLSGTDKVLDIRSGQPQEINDQETGEWTFVVDLEIKVFLASGV